MGILVEHCPVMEVLHELSTILFCSLNLTASFLYVTDAINY